MMQQVADDVINNPGNYNDNTHFSINYALTIKQTDGSFSYYSHNSMANWYTKTLGDTRFSLTMTDDDAARSYVEAYKQSSLKRVVKYMLRHLHLQYSPRYHLL
ncbi:MAG: hypothetical protein ACLS9K_01480 [Lachnospira eligens]